MTDQTPGLMGNRRVFLIAALAAVAVGLTVFLQEDAKVNEENIGLNAEIAYEKARDGEIVLVDIRTPEEWAETGIPKGAYPIDMRREDFLEVLAGLYPEDKAVPVALICAQGVRSARMAQQLRDAGYVDVVDVSEGMLGSAAGPGWLARELPVEPAEAPQE